MLWSISTSSDLTSRSALILFSGTSLALPLLQPSRTLSFDLPTSNNFRIKWYFHVDTRMYKRVLWHWSHKAILRCSLRLNYLIIIQTSNAHATSMMKSLSTVHLLRLVHTPALYDHCHQPFGWFYSIFNLPTIRLWQDMIGDSNHF